MTVTFDGKEVPAEAELVSDADNQVRRTAVLAMDVSNSMKGSKFEEAKAAAEAFLDAVPEDVYVGLVTFAKDVQVVSRPTQDTDSVRAALDSLQLSRETSLYDGVRAAVDLAGADGARSILVLSDGRDTSGEAPRGRDQRRGERRASRSTWWRSRRTTTRRRCCSRIAGRRRRVRCWPPTTPPP